MEIPADPLTIAMWMILKGHPKPIVKDRFPDQQTCERRLQRYGALVGTMYLRPDGLGGIIVKIYCAPIPPIKAAQGGSSTAL